MRADLVRTSKFLSLVLRHKPQVIGLELDEAGWVSVTELLEKAAAAGRPMTRAHLQAVVRENDKRRFEMDSVGARIRAVQGHSIPVALGYEPANPPPRLYHGTATRFLDSIRREGLTSQGRNFVHLSGDETTAWQVGRRHGRPVLLVVRAEEMVREGRRFFQAANGVWLTAHVPPAYIDFPKQFFNTENG